MKIKRDLLIRHLTRIMAGGQITEAVFDKAFATAAVTPDALLLVVAPPLPGMEDLPGAVGLGDLMKFQRSLSVLAGEGPQTVDVELAIEDHRLIIDEGERGRISLLTAAPKTIGTRIEAETVAKLLAKAPSGPQPTAKRVPKKAAPGIIPITQALVKGVRETFSLFKATEIELHIGPKGGRIRVGNENSDVVDFASLDLKAAEEYTLLFGEHVVDVLGIISDFSEAYILLGAEKEPTAIMDGGYRYIFSPKARPADAS